MHTPHLRSLQASFTGYDVRPSFSELVKWSDFWTWMIGGFAPGIFDSELLLTKSNATNASSTSQRHKAQSLYLVGGFRLHQVRVRPVECRGAFSTWLCLQGSMAAQVVANECTGMSARV